MGRKGPSVGELFLDSADALQEVIDFFAMAGRDHATRVIIRAGPTIEALPLISRQALERFQKTDAC
jgi:hypothetical protein